MHFQCGAGNPKGWTCFLEPRQCPSVLLLLPQCQKGDTEQRSGHRADTRGDDYLTFCAINRVPHCRIMVDTMFLTKSHIQPDYGTTTGTRSRRSNCRRSHTVEVLLHRLLARLAVCPMRVVLPRPFSSVDHDYEIKRSIIAVASVSLTNPEQYL